MSLECAEMEEELQSQKRSRKLTPSLLAKCTTVLTTWKTELCGKQACLEKLTALVSERKQAAAETTKTLSKLQTEVKWLQECDEDAKKQLHAQREHLSKIRTQVHESDRVSSKLRSENEALELKASQAKAKSLQLEEDLQSKSTCLQSLQQQCQDQKTKKAAVKEKQAHLLGRISQLQALVAVERQRSAVLAIQKHIEALVQIEKDHDGLLEKKNQAARQWLTNEEARLISRKNNLTLQIEKLLAAKKKVDVQKSSSKSCTSKAAVEPAPKHDHQKQKPGPQSVPEPQQNEREPCEQKTKNKPRSLRTRNRRRDTTGGTMTPKTRSTRTSSSKGQRKLRDRPNINSPADLKDQQPVQGTPQNTPTALVTPKEPNHFEASVSTGYILKSKSPKAAFVRKPSGKVRRSYSGFLLKNTSSCSSPARGASSSTSRTAARSSSNVGRSKSRRRARSDSFELFEDNSDFCLT
mmetsp:Transcript_11594/g.18860  ORF Transcript_11594/g.18860 Transcript_11594/m.18860 type:complete len:466 (-) Transcript_11594:39-1436(-)